MLVEITKVPNAENSAIHLHPTDNVAVARVPLPAGAELRVEGLPVTVRDAIPAGHKIALWDIAPGETVERYGQVIGRAKVPIDAGRHIHTHNLAFEELALDYEFPTTETPVPDSARQTPPPSSAIRARMAASAPATTSPWSPPAIAPPTPPN